MRPGERTDGGMFLPQDAAKPLNLRENDRLRTKVVCKERLKMNKNVTWPFGDGRKSGCLLTLVKMDGVAEVVRISSFNFIIYIFFPP